MRIEEVRTELCLRLRERLPEIEAATITRAQAVCDPRETADPEYTEGFRRTIAAALEYGIAALERGEEHAPPIPTVLLSQARLAARNRVPLDTVMRRYFAGYTVLGDYLIEEADRGAQASGSSLKRLLRAQATLFDSVLIAVSDEYARAAKDSGLGAERRRLQRVERLLAGELLETAELAYDFEGFQLALIAAGAQAPAAIRELASALDRRLLALSPGADSHWAWLGGRGALDCGELERALSRIWPLGAPLAIGEPAQGLAGWRLSHRQAKAAMSIALRRAAPARYAEVALLASIVEDDLAANSLRELYLAPLEAERDGGAGLRKTLRAYFAADRNISSAAAALGINRQTVTNHLLAIEERLGRRLGECLSEIDITLRLEELEGSTADR